MQGDEGFSRRDVMKTALAGVAAGIIGTAPTEARAKSEDIADLPLRGTLEHLEDNTTTRYVAILNAEFAKFDANTPLEQLPELQKTVEVATEAYFVAFAMDAGLPKELPPASVTAHALGRAWGQAIHDKADERLPKFLQSAWDEMARETASEDLARRNPGSPVPPSYKSREA